ncbi:MAG: sulfurtransferase TusA family protein [Nitrospirota bacterium]|nr:sulfurtransferase TusA family protein [Nitrospirota bacterium]
MSKQINVLGQSLGKGQRPAIGTPEKVAEEIAHFEAEAARFKAGEIAAEKFQGFRLRQGLYGQRGGEGHMLRLKLPYGRIDPDQMDTVANVGDKYSGGPAHVTTRQDFQFHYVQLTDAPAAFRDLAEGGITTREACGNTVRNVTACHLAGACSQELFDVTPYAQAVYEHFLRHPLTQNMPRKFKIAFSGCASDCARTRIHDIGLTAAVRDGVHGFSVVVGGGLGSAPRVAHPFESFIPVAELLPLCEALISLFDLYGNRKQRARARLKFLVERLGVAEVRSRYEQERAKLSRDADHYPALPEPEPNRNVRPWPVVAPNGDAFGRWHATSVLPEREPGLVSVQLNLLRGDIRTDQLRTLADMVRRYSAREEVRLTVGQNLVILAVAEGQVEALYRELLTAGLARSGAETAADVMSCPGSETCNLGLVASRQLAGLLVEHIEASSAAYDDAGGARIKVSGCPNSCGHHHIASIGFHGTARKHQGHMAPFYEVHLGGHADAAGTVIANPTLRVPAQHGPKVVDTLLDHYRGNRSGGESFDAFVERVGKESLKALLEPLVHMPSHDEDPSYYRDLGASEEFALEDMGPGECAGGVLDLIEVGLKEARTGIALSQSARDAGQWAEAAGRADEAVFSAAQALLVTEGEEVELVPEAAAKFTEKFIASGLFPAACATLFFSLGRHAQGSPDGAAVRKHLDEAERFVLLCEAAYQSMGNDLRLTRPLSMDAAEAVRSGEPVGGQAPAAAPTAPVAAGGGAGGAKVDLTLDLKGVACPMNYVKTKLKLEMMPKGSVLEVLLDDGAPIHNVPKSVANDGHDVFVNEPLGDGKHHRIVIRKV